MCKFQFRFRLAHCIDLSSIEYSCACFKMDRPLQSIVLTRSPTPFFPHFSVQTRTLHCDRCKNSLHCCCCKPTAHCNKSRELNGALLYIRRKLHPALQHFANMAYRLYVQGKSSYANGAIDECLRDHTRWRVSRTFIMLSACTMTVGTTTGQAYVTAWWHPTHVSYIIHLDVLHWKCHTQRCPSVIYSLQTTSRPPTNAFHCQREKKSEWLHNNGA